MPIKYIGLNLEIILRRFYKVGVNFSENAIFPKSHQLKIKRAVVF